MAYDPSTAYAKYLKKKCTENCSGCSEGCTDCKEDSECSCCPAGLIAIVDENGKQAGCLTPNDAALYNADKPCQPGYVKLYKTSTETFLGCVSESEFAALYEAVNA